MELAVLREGEWHQGPSVEMPMSSRTERLEVRQDLVVKGHLVAAHRAEVGGVEGEDHRLPEEL